MRAKRRIPRSVWLLAGVVVLVVGGFFALSGSPNRSEDQALSHTFDPGDYDDPIEISEVTLTSSEGHYAYDGYKYHFDTSVTVGVTPTGLQHSRFGPRLTVVLSDVAGNTISCAMGRSYLFSSTEAADYTFLCDGTVPFDKLQRWTTAAVTAHRL